MLKGMNQNRKTIETILLWTVKIGLWVIPLLPFYIASSMLFPFITGKNFVFRIIIEIIAPLWAGLAIMRPEFRPRLTNLVKVVTLLIVVLFLADSFGPNPSRSFFSNYERMEGFISFAHLYLYFLMLVSVFRIRRVWLVFFHVSIVASIAVSYMGLLQRLGLRASPQGGFRVDSTIGNPTYLAAYLLFHVWMFALLMKQFWPRRSGETKKWILEIIYGAVLLFELAIIYFTATRGVVLALLVTAIPFFAVIVLYWNRMFGQGNKAEGTKHSSNASWSIGRKIAGLTFVLVVAVPFIFWLSRNSNFVRQSPVLSRLTNYSLSETTITSRFLIWKMSWKGALERPMLGWGQENYYLVFQRYYDPGLYAQEPWFDRSHNIIFDWLIQAGFVGLGIYLLIFGAVFWMIIRGIRKTTFALWEGSVLIALFASYLFQNIFVFDNLNTYMLFFAFLAYAHYLASEHTAPEGAASVKPSLSPALLPHEKKAGYRKPASSDLLFGRGLAVMLVLLVVSGITIVVGNLDPIYQSQALIDSLRLAQSQTSVDKIIDQFKVALAYDSFGNTEVREQIGNTARTIIGNAQVAPDDQKKFAEFAITELKKEIDHPAKDIKHMIFLASIYNRGSQLDPKYIAQAEQLLLDALKLSPAKQIVYFELAQLYLATNHADRAIEALRKAWQLDTGFTQAGINLEIIAIVSGNKEIIAEVRKKIDHDILDEHSIYRLAIAYQQAQDYASALHSYEQLVKLAPNNAQYHATYAALLGYFRRVDEAIAQVNTAAKIDPTYQKEAEQFIKGLRAQPKK
jgi:O-antigen ligase/Tfp pilus assembly protein PilF